MLRISKLADYAALVLSAMAERCDHTHTAAVLAAQTGLNPPTTSKLLKLLTRAGLVASQRGTKGGYTLTRSPDAISAIHIIEAVEGPMAMTECTLATGLCELEPSCHLGSQWQSLSLVIRHALAEISLADLNGPPFNPVISIRLRPQATYSKRPTHGHT